MAWCVRRRHQIRGDADIWHKEQFPFPDRSHDREGSNYYVPAENLGYSPESRASLRKPGLDTNTNPDP